MKVIMMMIFMLMVAVNAYHWGRNDGKEKAAQEEARRERVAIEIIQKERLIIQQNCNQDKKKTANYAEICRLNDMNLGGNRGR